MASVVIDIASEFTGKNAFKQAETATGKLNLSVKKLAATLGIALGAKAVLNYSKDAVKAFAADDKAAKALSLTLKNLGLQYADPQAKAFISDLEKQYGVLDDQLRPAFQKLVTTTRDFGTAQGLLKTALDLSAMSGVDLQSVADDLSKAYSGNTKGLQKYGLGIDKATLATMSFDDILKVIATVSAGQAQEAADSYAGSLDRLNVASKNASESIGKDLVNALTTLGGSGGLPKTLALIESLASGIGDAIIGFSRLIRVIDIITGSGSPIEMIKKLNAFTKEYHAADAKEQKDAEIAARRYGGVYADIYNKQKKILTTKKALTKQELDALAAAKLKLAIDKANLALGKGNNIFDMDAIQLNAALIGQAEALGKATTGAQVLAIANDVQRLKVKQDISALEDAIASKDTAAIEKATAKLNKDMEILGALQKQDAKLLDINNVLAGMKSTDLINLANLQAALDLLAKFKFPTLTMPAVTMPGGTRVDLSTPTKVAEVTAKLPASVSTSDFFASLTPEEQAQLGGYKPFVGASIPSNGVDASTGSMAGSGTNGTGRQVPVQANYNFTINAGAVGTQQDLVYFIQDAIQKLNRGGDPLTTAGVL